MKLTARWAEDERLHRTIVVDMVSENEATQYKCLFDQVEFRLISQRDEIETKLAARSFLGKMFCTAPLICRVRGKDIGLILDLFRYRLHERENKFTGSSAFKGEWTSEFANCEWSTDSLTIVPKLSEDGRFFAALGAFMWNKRVNYT